MNDIPDKPKPKATWLNFVVDYGPVAVFFITYRLFRPSSPGHNPVTEVFAVSKSTACFMAATVIALALSKWKLGKISPMLWLTTAMVIGFGALTIWSQDESWIRHKPTAVYLMFAAALFWGWWRGRPTLKYLLQSAFDGLDDDGWRKLSRNWGFFFLFFAGLNEIFAHQQWFTFDQWLRAKLVVFMPLSFIFTFAHVPMLMRHGLGNDEQGPPN